MSEWGSHNLKAESPAFFVHEAEVRNSPSRKPTTTSCDAFCNVRDPLTAEGSAVGTCVNFGKEE